MECPNCQLINREEAAFCLECGAELGIQCPNCEKPLPPGAKFCDACGRDFRFLFKVSNNLSDIG